MLISRATRSLRVTKTRPRFVSNDTTVIRFLPNFARRDPISNFRSSEGDGLEQKGSTVPRRILSFDAISRVLRFFEQRNCCSKKRGEGKKRRERNNDRIHRVKRAVSGELPAG